MRFKILALNFMFLFFTGIAQAEVPAGPGTEQTKLCDTLECLKKLRAAIELYLNIWNNFSANRDEKSTSLYSVQRVIEVANLYYKDLIPDAKCKELLFGYAAALKELSPMETPTTWDESTRDLFFSQLRTLIEDLEALLKSLDKTISENTERLDGHSIRCKKAPAVQRN